ncbi:olfactory receptor 4S1-like [Periophthalmus magnuspinnatus]|uniref:olfactory receptor 4S1-like n=1 Tax=Periophthalmus magnuspinnatus TaxID=409849 RepID=UPI0024368314|nr:olfactory receptor 4S1-like [Periophthalmus magnuspinnatus]
MDNASAITVFTLSGLNGTEKYRIPLFVVTFLCYSLIWVANVTIIVTIIMDKNLHEPMYILLCNLCINGLFGTAGFYPKFLSDLLSSTHVISFSGCLLQGFVVHAYIGADLSILLVMSLDRYVSICRPLVYHSVMTRQRVGLLVLFAWLLPATLVMVSSITTFILKLCDSHIPRLYCINFFVNKLACTASAASFIIPACTYTIYVCHFGFICLSYFYLIRTCRQSKNNMSKFMQTCLPHVICLIIVGIGFLFDLMYIRFGSVDLPQGLQNFMAIEFLVVPPILNPVIYGMKLTQVRNRIAQLFGVKQNKGSHKFVKKKKKTEQTPSRVPATAPAAELRFNLSPPSILSEPPNTPPRTAPSAAPPAINRTGEEITK